MRYHRPDVHHPEEQGLKLVAALMTEKGPVPDVHHPEEQGLKPANLDCVGNDSLHPMCIIQKNKD